MGLIKKLKKYFNIKAGVSAGPISVEIENRDIKAEAIKINNAPIIACVGTKLSPPLSVKIVDADGLSLKRKSARLEFYNDGRLMSTQKIKGTLSKKSDNNGNVIFDDIIIEQTGSVLITITVDALEVTTEVLKILPPGLEVDFWNEKVGSSRYEEKLDIVLQFSNVE